MVDSNSVPTDSQIKAAVDLPSGRFGVQLPRSRRVAPQEPMPTTCMHARPIIRWLLPFPLHHLLFYAVTAVVHCLRKQRRGMVQTLEQYYFCYEAVLHELEQSCGSG